MHNLVNLVPMMGMMAPGGNGAMAPMMFPCMMAPQWMMPPQMMGAAPAAAPPNDRDAPNNANKKV